MLLKMFEFEIETVSYRMYLVMKIKENKSSILREVRYYVIIIMKYANIRRKQYGIPTTRFKSEKDQKLLSNKPW